MDTLEPQALKERLGSDKVAAEIVRMKPLLGDHIACEPPIYRDGTPWLIAVANAENGSAYEQFKNIVKTAVEPLLDIQKETGSVRCIVSYGGVINQPAKPGDIDLLVLTKAVLPPVSTDLESRMSTHAVGLMSRLSWISNEEGHGKLKFTIVGDTITSEHALEITVMSEEEFTYQYGIQGEAREKILEGNRRMMEEFWPEKAKKYEKLDMTFSETVALTGGK